MTAADPVRETEGVSTPTEDGRLLETLSADLPSRWSVALPGEPDAHTLTTLLRRHEEQARGWATARAEGVSVQLSDGDQRAGGRRHNLVVRDAAGDPVGWASVYDRAAGRMLLAPVVDPRLEAALADRVAAVLFSWAEAVGRHIGRLRGVAVQQVDSGSFAGDERQRTWLTAAGFEPARTWWQMTRPLTGDDRHLDISPRAGVRIRPVGRDDTGLPDVADLRAVHDVLESAFADHFNSHEETFEEFSTRLRQNPGHRWDHWWLAETLDDPDRPEPAGALVGSVTGGVDGAVGSYVDYIGVLQSARGRGIAKGLLGAVIADAAARGRDHVGLEVDAESPTGAEGLYLAMGWRTDHVTESWHRKLPVAG